ncbi:MAG: hypothetical protein K6F94_00875, partial [Bacteroidaceae bacterium]|nr:hypothetical protein [Bacteroidaceae bacterium]
MKHIHLFFLLTSLLMASEVKGQEAYTEADLTDNGWTEVTELNTSTLGQYYYVFYSVEGTNLMLAQGKVTGYQQDELTGVYKTAVNPLEDNTMVWTIDYDENLDYGLRNLSNPTLYMQSRERKDGLGPWNVQFHWET